MHGMKRVSLVLEVPITRQRHLFVSRIRKKQFRPNVPIGMLPLVLMLTVPCSASYRGEDDDDDFDRSD